MWGCRVRRDGTQSVEPAYPARPHRLAKRLVPGVEPALETDLQRRAGRLYLLEDGDRAGDAAGDRLLAEHRQAGPGERHEQFGMRGSGRRDDGSVEAGAEDVVACYGADPVGDQCGAGSVAIDDDDLVDLRQVNEGGGVERADASSTDHADPHDAPPSRHAAT
jgi:hypothetical protein